MERYGRTISAAAATILVSIALYPIFTGVAWFWAGVGATAVVGIAGTLTRRRRLPVVACIAGGLAGLLLYLNLAFEHSRSLLFLIPTPGSLAALWHLAGQGISQSSVYAPPVPELNGMVLLATGGIGLTALLTDLIAVRLGSAALAGLPLLLLFTEPFTLSVSRGWLGTGIAFCAATVGYLTMLSSEGRERIRDWEQPRPGRAPIAPDTSALAAAGRRVGVASVALALCVPLFIPGLHTTRLFGGGSPGIGGTLGGGPGGVAIPDPQTSVSKELRDSPATSVLSYTSSAADPGYFQVYVLDDLTASGWQLFGQPQSLTGAGAPLPSPPGLMSPSPLTTTSITVGKNVAQDDLLALPAPYPAVSVHAPGSLRADRNTLMIFDNGIALGGLSYQVTSADVQPTQQELAAVPAPPADIKNHYLEVPASYAPLLPLAESIVAGVTSPYAKAVALQNWLADGGFIYTLNAPTITDAGQLANFLEVTHSGYCQQFAFAMAVLARLLGIPSRVAYGFTQGTKQPNGQWLVTTRDAHAWPELYFQGYGWLRFEPTPGGSDGQGTATTPGYAQPQSSAGTTSTGTTTPTTPTTQTSTGGKTGQSSLNREKRALNADGLGGYPDVAAARAPGGLNPWALAGLSLLGLLALAAIVPGCARSLIRRRRWRAGARAGDAGLAHAAWQELRDDLTDYGGGYVPSESPRALADRVGTRLPAADQALRRVAMAAERARYSASPVSGATLRADSTAIRRAVAASAPRRRRWLARVFPSSVIAPTGLRMTQAVDVFGRLTLNRGKIPFRGKLASRAS